MNSFRAGVARLIGPVRVQEAGLVLIVRRHVLARRARAHDFLHNLTCLQRTHVSHFLALRESLSALY